jgi:signal transduction histidine kinase
MLNEVMLLASLSLAVLSAVIIFLFALSARRGKHIIKESRYAIDQEVARSKIEIQEQSLLNAASELQDNIGQLLSAARMQLKKLTGQLPSKEQDNVSEIDSLIGEALLGMRSLVKTLNTQVLNGQGFATALDFELERFKKISFITAGYIVKGNPVKLHPNNEVIIFRILQEYFSKTIQASTPLELDVSIEYLAEQMRITLRNNGIGSDLEKLIQSSAWVNIKRRAEILQADLVIESSPDKGVTLILNYFYRKEDSNT